MTGIVLTEIWKLLPPALMWHHEASHFFFPTHEGTEEQGEKSRKKTSYSRLLELWSLYSTIYSSYPPHYRGYKILVP